MASQHAPDSLDELRQWLVEDGLIQSTDAELIPLTGGVSSEIVLIRDRGRQFVAKRALPKLRVKDEWYAGTERNHYEHTYMEVAGHIEPDAFPEILHTNDQRGFFCMAWLGAEWENWKSRLLQGHAELELARRVARMLGRIHRHTAGRDDLAARFPTLKNFHALRIEPYLLTTGQRHPDLQVHFQREAERLAQRSDCLVHGDYSPKNLLVRDEHIKVLDCEVAWYGAASFDLAFLLNHLLLKTLYHAPNHASFAPLMPAAMNAYFQARALDRPQQDVLQAETLRLLLMLLLARVDGKSPVEYFQDRPDKQAHVRRFVRRQLPREVIFDPQRFVAALLRA